MSQTPNPNDPRPAERPNPSIESTRRDDEMARQAHEDARGVGTVVGAGLGCLGFTLAPWVMALVAMLAGAVVIVVVKSCGTTPGGTTQQSQAAPHVERSANHG